MRASILYILFLIAISTSAQETLCGDGIDNDGDGLVDCFDGDCIDKAICSDFYLGAIPPVTGCPDIPFTIEKLWESPSLFDSRATVPAGDIDNDGIVELLGYEAFAGVYRDNDTIYILDGMTGAVQDCVICPSMWYHNGPPAIADINKDGYGEIFYVDYWSILRCYEYNKSSKKWQERWACQDSVGYIPPPPNNGGWGGSGKSWSVGVADFNADGIVELYTGNQIYNASSGVKMMQGGMGNNIGSNSRKPNGEKSYGFAFPFACDILDDSYCADCAGLELICGNMVYSVNITSPISGNVSIASQLLDSIEGNYPAQDGFTAVADFNNDGELDIIVNSGIDSLTGDGGRIYVWDPRTKKQIGNTFVMEMSSNTPNNTLTSGIPSVADFDGDGELEIGIGGASVLIVIDNDMTEKWGHITKDQSSDLTTCSAFDFNGDGAVEVAFRDEDSLFVFDGASGDVLSSFECGSITVSEYPTIVDVNSDGHANIVCYCDATSGTTMSAPDDNSAKIVAFKGVNNDWVPTRRVMNQQMYAVVNINDDLTVPVQQQNIKNVSELNAFLQQVPITDQNGDPIHSYVGDAMLTIDSVSFDSCQYNIIVSICNVGSDSFAAGMQVTLFNGDPTTSGSLLEIKSIYSKLDNGFCESMVFKLPFGDYDLFAYANQDGSLMPNTQTGGTFDEYECNYDNNWDSVSLSSEDLTLNAVADQEVCNDESTVIFATGNNVNTFQWAHLNNPNNIFSIGPAFIFDEKKQTSYIIYGNKKGCVVEDTFTITPVNCDSNFFVPNIVSLNGVHNTFKIESTALDFLETSIYDRFGKLLYVTNDLNINWGATNQNNKKVNAGVYLYAMSGTLKNGDDFTTSGNITVIE